jgi:hypothetical protein
MRERETETEIVKKRQRERERDDVILKHDHRIAKLRLQKWNLFIYARAS